MYIVCDTDFFSCFYYIVTNLPKYSIDGIIFNGVWIMFVAMIGGIIGSIITYRNSLKLLEQRLEKENAIKFLTEHYLPLLGTLEWVATAWHIWTSNDTAKEEMGLSDEETNQIFSDNILKLSQTLESTLRSDAGIILSRISKDAYTNTLALDYKIKIYQHIISQINANDCDFMNEINKITPKIEELYGELEEITIMPELIEEYHKMINDKAPILETYLFSVDMGLEGVLNCEIIPKKLKKNFKTKEYPLSESAAIKKEDGKQGIWIITDKEREYKVKKVDGRLNVHMLH